LDQIKGIDYEDDDDDEDEKNGSEKSDAFLLPMLANAPEVLGRADDDVAVRNGQRGVHWFAKRLLYGGIEPGRGNPDRDSLSGAFFAP